MKRLLLIAMILTTVFVIAQAQNKTAKPEEKSIVSKEFDEDGNLIKYDSTFVWSWNGDSVFQFDFPMNGFFSGKDFPGFNESMMDSILSDDLYHHFFGFEPFKNDQFFKQFEQQFADSAFSHYFELFSDSTSFAPFSFEHGFNNDLFSNDFDALHKKLQLQLKEMDCDMPRFETEEQEKAWQDLLEKQQKEREELKKKIRKH